jgi:arylsulfatase A-like enzyme
MKPFLLLTLALSLTTLTHGQDRPSSAKTSDDKPNIVLFLVDDMGWMDSEPYGSEYYDTPNMSRLAKLSMRFTDAYAMPLCSPTRATLLSGQYPTRHLVTTASGHQPPQEPGASLYPEKASPTQPLIYAKSKNYLDPKIVTLAELLRDAGYRTGHFGKWHLGAAEAYWPDQNGFETTWFCTPDPGPPSYFSPYGVVAEGEPGNRQKVGNITDGPDGEYITDRLTDEAVGFIESHAEEPFFLNLWQYGVHGPWGHKEEYTREFAKKTDPRGEQRNPIMASMLKSVDDSLGRILDTLDEKGLTENTFFIFFSDNGGNVHSNGKDDRKIANIGPNHPKFAAIQDWKKWAGEEYPTNNAPLREGKGRIYEGGQRVPLMVRWPGKIEEGSLNSAIVHAVDLYPTILEAAKVGVAEEQPLDGLSLLPVLTEGAKIEREAIFTWFPFPQGGATVRSGNYKLVKRFETSAARPNLIELYDLETDIGETNDLAKEKPGVVARLDALLEAHLEDAGALRPKPNPNFNEAAAKVVRTADFGLVPKQCETQLGEGILRVTPVGKNPFLGTAQVKFPGPLTLRMTLRSEDGGTGRIAWKTAKQESFSEDQVVDYSVAGGSEWEKVEVTIPVKGATGLVRIYLPEGDVTEFQSIEYSAKSGGKKGWDFAE